SHPQIIEVQRVWHNSLRSIVLPTSNFSTLSSGDEDLLKEVCQQAAFDPDGDESPVEEIGALQGSSLASLLHHGHYFWNEGKGAQPIVSDCHYAASSDVSITVLGPQIERLSSLRDLWIGNLRVLGVAGVVDSQPLFEDAFEFMNTYQAIIA